MVIVMKNVMIIVMAMKKGVWLEKINIGNGKGGIENYM